MRRKNSSLVDISMERKSPEATTATWSAIFFNDPFKKPEQEYSLHLRKSLPELISKCQERCGKNITPNDILILKTSRKTSWTDTKTGQKREEFGPMYLHFQEDCLKQFGEKDYTIVESFVFGKIKKDEITKKELTEKDLEFLKLLGINWVCTWCIDRIHC